MKRVFGIFEAVFDILYLGAALLIGVLLIMSGEGNPARILAGIMALTLAIGDAFHLLPRIMVIRTRQETWLRPALGRGKQITSITMTIYYLLLWQIGLAVFAPDNMEIWTMLIYLLAAVRIVLCLLPQNRWQERFPPLSWGIWRNIPFFLLGAAVAAFFFAQRQAIPALGMVWLAIALSFAFYLPVVLWANTNPKIGMLMLPKTSAYIWMLIICLSL